MSSRRDPDGRRQRTPKANSAAPHRPINARTTRVGTAAMPAPPRPPRSPAATSCSTRSAPARMGSVWRARDLRTARASSRPRCSAPTTARRCCASCASSRCGSAHPHVLDAVRAGPPRTTGSSSAWTWSAAAPSTTCCAEHGPLPASYVARAARPAPPGARRRARRGRRAPRREAGQPAARADRRRAPFLRLGDFGVAVPVEDVRLTRVPGAVGTDGYMAPEQARRGGARTRARTCTPPAWSAIQLLTGRPPRPGRAPLVPEGPLRPLLAALVDPDPRLRPPTAAAALERLRRIERAGRRPVARRTRPARRASPRVPGGAPVADDGHRRLACIVIAPVPARVLPDAALTHGEAAPATGRGRPIRSRTIRRGGHGGVHGEQAGQPRVVGVPGDRCGASQRRSPPRSKPARRGSPDRPPAASSAG